MASILWKIANYANRKYVIFISRFTSENFEAEVELRKYFSHHRLTETMARGLKKTFPPTKKQNVVMGIVTEIF